MIFTTIGSAADYGTFGRWLLLVITCICWASQFAEMSLTSTSFIFIYSFNMLSDSDISTVAMAARHGAVHDRIYHIWCHLGVLRGPISSPCS